MSAAELRVVEGDQGQLIGAKPPLVTPGTYDLMYVFDETILLVGGRVPKLAIWFRITTPGQFIGTKLPRYYNVTTIEGKPRRSGGFKVGWRSAFMREFAAVFDSVPLRTNRIPMSRFEGTAVRGRVRTVTSTWYQKPSPVPLHYSVIEELLPPTPVVSPTPAVAPSPTPAPTPTLKEGGKG
jgi:hypothetical protein